MNTISTSTISSSFLNNLKAQTADSHKKLEELSVSKSILSPDMKIEEYTKYLSLMHDVHLDTEDFFFPLFANLIEDLQQRRKKQLIEADLSFLNYELTASEKVFKIEKTSVPFALGILYVVEGSTLGGRFILKNISKGSRFSGGEGVSYFSGYRERTGIFWKSFLDFLTEYEIEHNCADSIIEGAIFAFDSIYNHFKKSEKNDY